MRASAQIHRPMGPLADFVECIWLWQTDTACGRKERVLPSGTLDIVVHLGDEPLRVYHRTEPERVSSYPGIMIAGAHSGYFVIDPPPRGAVLGVHFKPGGAFPFLGVQAGDLEDAHANLEAVWGHRARRLRERLLETTTDAERVRCTEAFLLEGAVRALERHPDVADALAAIEGAKISSVAELRARTGISAKRLIALFHDQVGIGPKALWRIRRFQAALRQIECAQASRGAEIAGRLGYFDQAHMLRDFRDFTGMSPRAYLLAGSDRPNHVPHPG
ncbi:helix-turn-helix domain-containing protein [Pendulispora brunnea]|uniref:Helix-turn-helix domain-containing protein n=1 Tax=Pendulispora brunnea TaxID=2905690 RepID=A0ABZ2JVR9_9BACT